MAHEAFPLRLAGTVALVSLAGARIASPTAAQSIQLNGTLAPELRSGDVVKHAFTADGTRLVYEADRDTPGLHELFSVPADGSGPSVRLHAPLAVGRQVRSWSIGAGHRVVFVADPASQGVYELASVPADASAPPTLLSPTPAFVFWLNTAGDYVYFRDSVAPTKLQRVPIDGSALPSVVVTAPQTPLIVHFSPDGLTALLRMFGPSSTERLHSIPADGSGPLVLLHQTATGNLFQNVRFASDGVHIVFEEVQIEGIFFPNFLFSVPLDGSSASVQLNTTQQYAGSGYELDASSSQGRLVYQEAGLVYSIAFDGTQRALLTPAGWASETADFSGAVPLLDVRGSDVVFEAHSAAGRSILRAPLDGSQAAVPLFAPSSITSVTSPEILASGTVVYLAGSGLEFGTALYSVPLAGGTPTLLDPPQLSNRGPNSFLVHPDELRAVFRSDASGKDDIYVVPLDGSQAPLRLNTPLIPAGGTVGSYSFTADGLSVAFVADPLINDLDGVFRAPLDGLGPVVQYNEPIAGSATGGDVLEFQATRDGRQVVHRADEDEDESYDLFVAGTFGRGRSRPLTASPAGSPGVRPGFALAPDGERVVFQGLEEMLFSLRTASTTPGPASIELDTAAVEFPLPLAIAPDGTRVVYRKSETGSGDLALLSAPLDGSSAPVTLHAPFASGRSVQDSQIDPASTFAVHRADEELDNVFELFSVPLDGSAPPVRLHPPLAAGRTVTTYRISPDGERVVFLSTLELAGRVDLFSVPIDGSFAARKLDQTLASDRDVFDFQISPDGRWVVYRANALDEDRYDLFRVPIEGLVPPRRRTGGEAEKGARIRLTKLTGLRRVQADYVFSADGSQVLFRINTPNFSAHFDLHRVPADGSANAVQLSALLGTNRTVSSFAVAPDESRVVYLADGTLDEVFELFSVPFAGGTSVALDPQPPSGDVSSFRIDARSRRVVFLADGITDGVVELFAAPLDGSAPAERLNGPLPVGGDVEPDYALLPGGRTLYRADQDANDELEIFVSLERPVFPR